jgi:hypothetical protein
MTCDDSSFDDLVLHLSRARAESLDFSLAPWESNSESVRECWNNLTNPHNMERIKHWADKADEMNPAARAMVLKALEVCLLRSKENSDNL